MVELAWHRQCELMWSGDSGNMVASHILRPETIAMQTTIARSLTAFAAAATFAVTPAAAQTLYSQASLVTNPGAAVGGANVSAVQTGAGSTTYGITANATSGFRVADNFTISGNPWTISGFRFFGYQTNSPSNLSSPFTSVGWQIWSGRPGDSGSMVVAGNIATNTLTYTGFSGIYRTIESQLTNTQRPVMVLDANAGNVVLGAGTYWLEWTLGNTGNAFVPPVTFAGMASSGNARQLNVNSGNWTNAKDNENNVELPFEVFGEVNCNVVPEPSTYALMATGLVGMAGVARRRRRTV